MSYHNHDYEEQKRPQPVQPADPEIEHEKMMLERLARYELTDKHKHFIEHILTKVPEANRVQMLHNYIHGLCGQAVLDYENYFVRQRTDIKCWFI